MLIGLYGGINLYKNFDVVFLGGLFPKEREEEIIKNSIGSIDNAANNLQWEIVKGLDSNLDNPIKIFNSLFIGSFPKRYKKMTIDTFNFSHFPSNLEDINVGFLNITGIKYFYRYFSLKPYLNKWALSENNKKKVIIAYAMNSTFTHLLQYVKKINSNVITCLIVPDLPQYMDLSTHPNKMVTLLKNIEIKQIKWNMKYIDSYVLLTEYMQQSLNIRTPIVIMEGIATDLFNKIDKLPEREEGIRTILYSGGLMEKYGIINLVNAFQQLSEEHYRLIICGSGSAESEIIKACNKDKRIMFKGLLKREEVLKLQKSSTVLVNPRPNNEEYTKFSFPSKILEYLSSGTPVISYKLDGMPSEYFDHIYPVNGENNELFFTLKEVMSKSEKELREKGLRAKEFVLKNKNRNIQASKILNMINSI
jgi:glycosyltransferase involved in cell wall biosynthesis